MAIAGTRSPVRDGFLTGLAWFVALLMFFPMFWMLLNGFKTELDANTNPKLFFEPTLGRYDEVLFPDRIERDLGFWEALTEGDLWEAFSNSFWISPFKFCTQLL